MFPQSVCPVLKIFGKKVRKYIIFSALFLRLSALIYGGIILFTRGKTHYIMQLPYPE